MEATRTMLALVLNWPWLGGSLAGVRARSPAPAAFTRAARFPRRGRPVSRGPP